MVFEGLSAMQVKMAFGTFRFLVALICGVRLSYASDRFRESVDERRIVNEQEQACRFSQMSGIEDTIELAQAETITRSTEHLYKMSDWYGTRMRADDLRFTPWGL